MVGTRKHERRAHPRRELAVDGHLACHTAGGPLALRARNISCSGLYCHVPRYLPPFTRVNVAMALPIHDASAKAHNETFAVEGVVVRTDPEQERPDCHDYRVAIFFAGIDEEARALIARYVRQHDASQLLAGGLEPTGSAGLPEA